MVAVTPVGAAALMLSLMSARVSAVKSIATVLSPIVTVPVAVDPVSVSMVSSLLIRISLFTPSGIEFLIAPLA